MQAAACVLSSWMQRPSSIVHDNGSQKIIANRPYYGRTSKWASERASEYQGTARDRRGAQILIYEMPILPNNFDISHNASRILFRSNYICKATLIPFKQKRKINNLILSGLEKELIAVSWRHSFRNRNRNQDRVGNGSEDYEISEGQNYTKISAQLYWELLILSLCLFVFPWLVGNGDWRYLYYQTKWTKFKAVPPRPVLRLFLRILKDKRQASLQALQQDRRWAILQRAPAAGEIWKTRNLQFFAATAGAWLCVAWK